MSRWHWRKPFTREEIEDAFRQARWLPLNFDGRDDEAMTPQTGWSQVRSIAVVAREVPEARPFDGAFDWARHLMHRLAFSDPRIVTIHLPHEGELGEGDVVLLELRSFGPRFLCPVRIAKVEERTSEGERRSVLALETLQGHVERGREWFRILEDRRTGEVRFQIEAHWRAGDFPAFWQWLGFQLVARRYQRAWHHLAHQRMRRLIALHVEEEPMPTHPEPISFYARKSTGAWRAAVEQELERIRSDRLLRVAALGALSGARSFTPLAWIAAHHVRKGRPEGAHPLLNRKAAAALAVASAGELAFDKYPRAPSRIDPPALAGRALTGGLVGSALGRLGERTRKKTPIVLGALAAIAGTLLSYQARRALSKRIGPFAAALTEDVLTLGGTALVTRTL